MPCGASSGGEGLRPRWLSSRFGALAGSAFPELVGYTLTTNVSSRRVLEKAGLQFEREVEHVGLPHWYGRLDLRR